MQIPISIPRRVALVGFLLLSLVMLADWIARSELTWIVSASGGDSARLVTHFAVADD